ncbi:MAG: hypothetical protein L0Y56_10275 [Nitrospira sp.]|nr:hypothetical protein [Nitrospira sp.]
MKQLADILEMVQHLQHGDEPIMVLARDEETMATIRACPKRPTYAFVTNDGIICVWMPPK